MTKALAAATLFSATALCSWLLPNAEEPAPTSGAISETASAAAVVAQDLAPDARAAIASAIPYLEREGLAWLEGRTPVQSGNGCVSCHQVPFGVWGLQEARRIGIDGDRETTDELTHGALDFLARPSKARVMSVGPLVLAKRAEDMDASKWASFLLAAQDQQGHWEARGQFPGQRRPLEETNAVASLWTILALAETDRAGTRSSLAAESIDRALGSIHRAGTGASTEWLLLQSIVEDLPGLGAGGDARRAELLSRQNPDGGWSWNAGEESNALSTGQALYALSRRRSDPERKAVRRGTRFLLDTQERTGSWSVASKLTSVESSEDKDYVYAYWGTAWATIGLARTLAGDEETDA